MPGMCQRITRQSNAAKATSRRGRRDAHPELEERKIVAGDVVDKVDKIDMEDKVEDKGSREGRGVLCACAELIQRDAFERALSLC